MFERATPPTGIAPVAGHIDQHGSPGQAAIAEVAEEVGLAATHLHPLLTGWRPNRCRRPGDGEVGHRWWNFQAQTTGPLYPSACEVRALRWIHPDQLQQYAQRTAAYAVGQISEPEFAAQPGLTPVWVCFLDDLQLLTMPADTLAQIDRII